MSWPHDLALLPVVSRSGANAYSGGVLNVQSWPDLTDPVVVIAFSGWVDAGVAGSGAAVHLATHVAGARVFGHVDLTELADLQRVRPTVKVEDGVFRSLTWPQIDLVAGTAGRDFVVVHGPEPARMWPSFAAELVGMAEHVGARMVIGLGGMPTVSSHRRPMTVMATATAASVAQEMSLIRPDYNGPTGIQTVVLMAMGRAGIPAVGLWAQVPHYVSATNSPTAVRALLERLRDVAGVLVDLGPLDAQVDEYHAGIERQLGERPDIAEMVQSLEEAQGSRIPTGDELASEIERFLRDN